MCEQVVHYLITQIFSILLFKLIKRHIDVVISKLKCISDILLVGAIKDRRGYLKTKYSGSETKMNLKHLSDIHT